ncbi:MAG: hypothetical protein O2887_16570 [Bacteroidetes bacterium]|nr:hypothetical protein [Bacteroidota bacterium]
MMVISELSILYHEIKDLGERSAEVLPSLNCQGFEKIILVNSTPPRPAPKVSLIITSTTSTTGNEI